MTTQDELDRINDDPVKKGEWRLNALNVTIAGLRRLIDPEARPAYVKNLPGPARSAVEDALDAVGEEKRKAQAELNRIKAARLVAEAEKLEGAAP